MPSRPGMAFHGRQSRYQVIGADHLGGFRRPLSTHRTIEAATLNAIRRRRVFGVAVYDCQQNREHDPFELWGVIGIVDAFRELAFRRRQLVLFQT